MDNGSVGASLIAQAGQQGREEQKQEEAVKQPAVDPCPTSMLIPMAIVFALFYLIVLKPNRRQEKQRRELLAAIKKNDRVITIGGIYGVVTNVAPEQDEITIRVDDTNNTRLRVSRGSIQRVITDAVDQQKK